MNGIENGFSFGWTLAAKSCLLLALGLALSAALRKRSASLRHLLWTAVLAALVLLPAAMYFARQEPEAAIELPVLPERAAAMEAVAPSSSSRPMVDASARDVSLAASRFSWADLLALSWISGSVLLLARLGVGVAASVRAARSSRPLEDESFTALLESGKKQLGIRKEVRLRIGDASTIPMTLGLFRSTILLPEDAPRYSPDRKSGVLLHELAHVRRRDCLTLALGELASALYWWNPAVWIASREMRLLGERASDDLVLSAGARPAEYAHDLLEMARGLRRSRFAPLASVSMAHHSRLEDRLLAILNPALPRKGVGFGSAAVLASAGLILVAVVALAVPTRASRQEEEPPEPPPASQSSQPPEPETAPEPAEQPATEQPAPPAPTPRPDTSARDRAREALAEALDDPEADVREQAIHALVQMEDQRVAPYLRTALRDADPEIREQAAWGLGQLQHREAWEDLANALGDESPSVRSQVAWALGMLEDTRAIDALSRALKDESAEVRANAAWALGMIANQDPDPELELDLDLDFDPDGDPLPR